MAPDLWEMEEFDWDAPESQKWLKEEEEKRTSKFLMISNKFWTKLYNRK